MGIGAGIVAMALAGYLFYRTVKLDKEGGPGKDKCLRDDVPMLVTAALTVGYFVLGWLVTVNHLAYSDQNPLNHDTVMGLVITEILSWLLFVFMLAYTWVLFPRLGMIHQELHIITTLCAFIYGLVLLGFLIDSQWVLRVAWIAFIMIPAVLVMAGQRLLKFLEARHASRG